MQAKHRVRLILLLCQWLTIIMQPQLAYQILNLSIWNLSTKLLLSILTYAATSKEKNNKVYKEVAKAYASKATEKAIKEQYPDGGELPAWNLKL